MALEFLKIYADFEEDIEELTDEERGQLLTSMIAYAFHDEDIKPPQGGARYAWPGIRRYIKSCTAVAEKNRVNGAKGGRPPKAVRTDNNPAETQTEPTKSLQEQVQVQEQVQIQEKRERARARAHAREDAPPPPPPASPNGSPDVADSATTDPIIGVDGTDISEGMERYAEVERLIKRYRLSDNDVMLSALLEDAERYGLATVEDALSRAAMSDTRGGISLNYYRRFLPQAVPHAAQPTQQTTPQTTNPFLQLLQREEEKQREQGRDS